MRRLLLAREVVDVDSALGPLRLGQALAAPNAAAGALLVLDALFGFLRIRRSFFRPVTGSRGRHCQTGDRDSEQDFVDVHDLSPF